MCGLAHYGYRGPIEPQRLFVGSLVGIPRQEADDLEDVADSQGAATTTIA